MAWLLLSNAQVGAGFIVVVIIMRFLRVLQISRAQKRGKVNCESGAVFLEYSFIFAIFSVIAILTGFRLMAPISNLDNRLGNAALDSYPSALIQMSDSSLDDESPHDHH